MKTTTQAITTSKISVQNGILKKVILTVLLLQVVADYETWSQNYYG